MSRLTKTIIKSFNRDKLFEEFLAGGFVVMPSLAGFERVSEREHAPSSGPRLVSSSSSPSGTVEVFAQSGDIYIDFPSPPTAQQEADIDAILANHVHTAVSSNQASQDLDEADLDQARAAWQNWSTFTDTQKMNALKKAIRLLYRMMRGEEP